MLSFIVFGWPEKEKYIGPVMREPCPNCANETYWHVFKFRRWLSVFFVPLLPIGRSNYWVLCEVCAVGAKLNSDQAEEATAVAKKAMSYLDGNASKQEVWNEMEKSDELYLEVPDEQEQSFQSKQIESDTANANF